MPDFYYQSQLEQWAHSAWKRLDLSPPCDLRRVSEFLGIEVERVVLPNDLNGIYYLLPSGQKIIKLNSGLPQNRLRLVWAHEIGHALDNHEQFGEIILREGEAIWDSPASESAESRAAEFAIHLLMPELYLKQECERLGHPQTNRTGTLAELFGVEHSLMRQRLGQIGIVKPSRKRKSPEQG